MFISRGKYRWKFLEKFKRIRVNERSSMIIDDSEGWLALRIFPPVIKKKKINIFVTSAKIYFSRDSSSMRVISNKFRRFVTIFCHELIN